MKGAKLQLQACVAVADSALSADAARAKLDKPMLSAREFDSLLEDTLRDRVFPFCRMPDQQVDPYQIATSASISPATSVASAGGDSKALSEQMKAINRQLQSMAKTPGVKTTPQNKQNKQILSNGLQVCNQWNQERGCPRDPTATSCTIPNGAVLSHACSFKTRNGLCGLAHQKYSNH